MRLGLGIAAAALASLAGPSLARGEVLTFEEFDPGYATLAPFESYHGFTWTNASYVSHPSYGPIYAPGYIYGTLGAVAAVTPGAGTSLVFARADGATFGFNSAYMTAARDWSQDVTVEGMRGGATLYRQVVLAGSGHPCPFQFGFADVDAVVITPSGLALTLDNLDVVAAADTIPPTITLRDTPPITPHPYQEIEGSAVDQDGATFGLTGAITIGGVRTPLAIDEAGRFQASVPLAEGANDLIVEVTDAAQNTARRALSVTVDTIPPRVEFLTPTPDAPILTLEYPVSVRVVDATAVTVILDSWLRVPVVNGVATATLMVPWRTGPFFVSAEATDAAGNVIVAYGEAIAALPDLALSVDVRSGSAIGPLPGDRLPARITVVSPYETAVRTSCGDAFTVPAGGGAVDATLLLVEGPNEHWVQADDLGGQWAAVPVLVLYDRTPPFAAFRWPIDGAVVRGTVDVALDASDAVTSVAAATFAIDAGVPIPAAGGSPWTAALALGGIPDGAHAISATVADAVGNVATSVVNVIVDGTAPSVSIAAPAEGEAARGTIRVEARAADATSGVRTLRLLANGVEFASCEGASACAAALDTTRLPDGPFVVAAVATDLAGNEARAQRCAIADNTAPSRFLLAPAPGQIVTGAVEVVVVVDDPGFANAECSVGGVPVGASAEPAFRRTIEVTTVPDGPLDVACTAVDLAGNAATESVTVVVTNWALALDPGVLVRGVNASPRSVVTLHVEGGNVALLAPASAHALALAVPGGSPVPAMRTAASEQVGDADEDGIPELTLKFERAALVSAIEGGIAAGVIPAGARVSVRVLDGARSVGTATIQLR